MKTETIVMCVVALLIGMLLANMLKNVCGCKTVEGNYQDELNKCEDQVKECTRACENMSPSELEKKGALTRCFSGCNYVQLDCYKAAKNNNLPLITNLPTIVNTGN